MTTLKKARHLAIATALMVPAAVAPVAAQAGLTGNIGVHSKYLLRGIFEENNGAVVQGGIDWAGDSGFFLGYWGSSLGYSYDATASTTTVERGFENDLYGGYAGTVGSFSYDVGLLQYYYLNVDDSNLTELTGGIGTGPVKLAFQYLLTDGWWGNAGDTYWKLSYSQPLPKDFTFAALFGYYTYDDDDADNTERGWATTTTTSEFRHLNLTVSHPVGDTGASAYLQYTVAGKDRTGTEYDDSMVMGLTYGFDL